MSTERQRQLNHAALACLNIWARPGYAPHIAVRRQTQLQGPYLGFARSSEEGHGFWRGRRLHGIEPRLKPGGKYEMATLELVEQTPLERSTVVELVKAAVALNASHGDPTVLDR